MKRIGIVGLCLTAMFALSAMGASSAFAGEYGVCAKAAKSGKTYTGKYTDKNCTAGVTTGGKYEWSPYPGPAGTKWGSTSKGKTSELKTVQGTVTCKKNTDKGLITGAKTDEEEVTFTECTNNVFSTPCYNVEATKTGKKGGTIVVDNATKLIDNGEKGGSGKEPAPGEVWNEFSAKAPNPYVAVFYCVTPLGEDPFYVVGDVSGVVTGDVNAMSAKSLATFSATGGEQDLITNTAGLVSHEIEPFASEQIGTGSVKAESKIEIKA
jgi:hypothetical protein